jgi:RNA-directed DNA polymerase
MTRQYSIPQPMLEEAWKLVRRNKGAAGIDGVTVDDFENDLENNLYKIWNRMTAGSYFPPPVRIVEIPKSSGGKRSLGIPTVADRVAQTVAKKYLEPIVEPKFHKDSYGYRPGRQQHHALETARQRCWRYDWAVEIDIKGYFDNIDHELLLGLLREHTDLKWLLLYVERWLKAGCYGMDSTTIKVSEKGSPQGSVISPLLSNIFLHHAFDMWMEERYPELPFERFADDIIIHCHEFTQAVMIKDAVAIRLTQWKLQINEEKTRIVYCKDNKRKGKHEPIVLQFLGYEFKPRRAENQRDGTIFTSYLPAIGSKARTSINEQIRDWKLTKHTQETLEDLSGNLNAQIRGWLNYFGKFYGSAMEPLLDHVDETLARWAKRKYKKLRTLQQARNWLTRVKVRQPDLFAHWQRRSRASRVIRAV